LNQLFFANLPSTHEDAAAGSESNEQAIAEFGFTEQDIPLSSHRSLTLFFFEIAWAMRE